jgi:hypothetical protein
VKLDWRIQIVIAAATVGLFLFVIRVSLEIFAISFLNLAALVICGIVVRLICGKDNVKADTQDDRDWWWAIK